MGTTANEDRNVVVTGGAGFLGSHLCERLLATGHHVTCVDNARTGRWSNLDAAADHPDLLLVDRDVADRIDLDHPVAAVYHLAGAATPTDHLVDPVTAMRTASLGTLSALELARERRARFVLASTSEVYGTPGPDPSREDDPLVVEPDDRYGTYRSSRRFAEALVRTYRESYGMSVGIARVFGTYGPRMRLDDGKLLSRLISQALAGQPLTDPTSGVQRRSLCFVGAIVVGLVELAESAFPGPLNLGGPRATSVLSLARRIAAIVGQESVISFLDPGVDDSPPRYPDIGLAMEVLGWVPQTGLDEGLAITIASFEKTLARRR